MVQYYCYSIALWDISSNIHIFFGLCKECEKPMWIWAILDEAQLNLFEHAPFYWPLDELVLEGVPWLDVGLVGVTSVLEPLVWAYLSKICCLLILSCHLLWGHYQTICECLVSRSICICIIMKGCVRYCISTNDKTNLQYISKCKDERDIREKRRQEVEWQKETNAWLKKKWQTWNATMIKS